MVEITESTEGNTPPPAAVINPTDMTVSPHEKIGLLADEPVKPIGEAAGDPRAPSALGSDTPQYGTETPYRKTPPTNIGSVAEAAATATPPTGAAVDPADAVAVATPVCTVAPAVTGTPTLAQTLTCAPGTWVPAANSYTYQWYYYPDTVVAGATAATRVLAAGDVGNRMFCRVTGKLTSGGGSSPKDSNVVGPIAAA